MKKYLIALFVLVLVGIGIFMSQRSKTNGALPLKEVQVTRANLEINIMATGIVQPENRVDIKAPVAGRVEQVFVQEGDELKRGQKLAIMSSSERAALIDAARSQGSDEVKRWEELYKPTPILAPIKGSLIHRNVEPGQSFTISDALFTMSDRLTVKAQVDETDIAQIKIGQKATIVLDAYPDQQVPAVVDQIAFDAKTVNNVTTYIVDVLPQEKVQAMRSGMTANVKFFIFSKENALTIPSEALKVKDGKYFVQLKTPQNPKGTDVEIKVGANDQKKTEVLEGLTEGQSLFMLDFELMSQQQAGTSKSSNPFMPMGGNRKSGGGGSGSSGRARQGVH